MVCPNCQKNTRVVNSRWQKNSNSVWRRRQCVNCKNSFTTQENLNYALSWSVIDDKGQTRPFTRDRLFLSLYTALKHRSDAQTDASALTSTIIERLALQTDNFVMTISQIAGTAQVALSRFDHLASLNYEAQRNN